MKSENRDRLSNGTCSTTTFFSSGGWTRTITRLLNREPPYHWATPEFASAQRELNPHFRHGKAAGYRYIMGAKLHHNQIVKDQ